MSSSKPTHVLRHKVEPTEAERKRQVVQQVLTGDGAAQFWVSFRSLQDCTGTGPYWDTTAHDVLLGSNTPLPILGGATFEGTTSRSVEDGKEDEVSVDIRVIATTVQLVQTPPQDPQALDDLVQVTMEQMAYLRVQLPHYRFYDVCPGVFIGVSPDNKVFINTVELTI